MYDVCPKDPFGDVRSTMYSFCKERVFYFRFLIHNCSMFKYVLQIMSQRFLYGYTGHPGFPT